MFDPYVNRPSAKWMTRMGGREGGSTTRREPVGEDFFLRDSAILRSDATLDRLHDCALGMYRHCYLAGRYVNSRIHLAREVSTNCQCKRRPRRNLAAWKSARRVKFLGHMAKLYSLYTRSLEIQSQPPAHIHTRLLSRSDLFPADLLDTRCESPKGCACKFHMEA